MASNHTPGPWKFAAKGGYLQVDAPAHSICRVCNSPESFLNKRSDSYANGHLIAAAPDLLAALKSVMALIDDQLLIRDISRDGEPGWAIKQAPIVTALADAVMAIKKAERK